MRRALACALSVLLAVWAQPASARETIGSGLDGSLDGAPARASFAGPRGLAYDAEGNLYVADASAQRIRKIARSGLVSTIAGGGDLAPDRVMAPGGYRDGPAAQARFNRPSALAVDRSGIVYVADTDNHCVRAIHNGVVSTFAGTNERGTADGTRQNARFVSPFALAFDSAGRLFVADHRNAVRVIERDGMVRTLKLAGDLANFYTGIAVFGSGSSERLVVATHLGAMIVSYPSLALVRLYRDEPRPPFTAADAVAELHRSIGYPFAVAALGPDAFVASDPRAHAIRIYDRGRTGIIAGAGRENSQLDSPGFSDAAELRFFAPTGIAVADDGMLAVADTGNRSIRFMRIPIPDHALDPGTLRSKDAARMLLVAGSRRYTAAPMYYESVAGQLAQIVAGKRDIPTLVADRGILQTAASLQTAAHTVRCVVWLVDADDVNRDLGRPAGTPLESSAIAVLRAPLASATAWAQRTRARLVVMLVPTPAETSPAATMWSRELTGSQQPEFVAYAQDEALLHGLFSRAGLTVTDAFASFAGDQRSENPHLLFGTTDAVLTPNGIRLVAGAIAGSLKGP